MEDEEFDIISLTNNEDKSLVIEHSVVKEGKGKNKKEIDVYEIYLYGTIKSTQDYHDLIATCRSAKTEDAINFFISSEGGDLDAALAISNSIRSANAATTAVILDKACSAATIIALSCGNLVMSRNSYFMLHNYSSTTTGKGNELKVSYEFFEKFNKKLFEEFYSGFLTKKELKKLSEGQDYYFDARETMSRYYTRLDLLDS